MPILPKLQSEWDNLHYVCLYIKCKNRCVYVNTYLCVEGDWL